MARPQSSSKRPRRTGRAKVSRRTGMGFLRELLPDLSWPVTLLTLCILIIGFGPLLLLDGFNTEGLGRKVLAATGPVLVCLAFAVMTYFFGMRHADETGMSRQTIWAITILFVVLGILAGWGLFVSV
jgi:hypothetical protein